MGSIASRFQNFQLAPQCPEIQEEIGEDSDDDDDANDSTVSAIENNCGIPENVANVAITDNYQALNTSVVPSVNCPEIQDKIGAVSNSDSSDHTLSMIDNSIGAPENETTITNNESSLTPNTFNFDYIDTASMSVNGSFADSSCVFGTASNMSESNFFTAGNTPNVLEDSRFVEIGLTPTNTSVVPSVNCCDSNDSTLSISMIDNSIGVTENESNITNYENFPESNNTFNLDDIETMSMSELNVRHVDDVENSIGSFADTSSVFGTALNMSESNVVTVEPRFAGDSRFVETGLRPKKTTLSRAGVAPGQGRTRNLGTSSHSSTLVLKNATSKLSTGRQPQKSRIMRVSKKQRKKGSGICRFCKLKMRKTERNTTTRKHNAVKRNATPFKFPKTVKTILKYTSDAASPKTNAYHNFLLYYNIRCNDAPVSGRQRRTCRKARHVWRTMSAEEKLPFSLLAQKERRKRLRQIQSLKKSI